MSRWTSRRTSPGAGTTAGLYATIPVGAPLFDDEMNIYFSADDAIRKFSVAGDLIWSYAPRGQLAAAPTLAMSSSRRISDTESEEEEMEESLLRPDWAKGNESEPAPTSFMDLRIGDLVKVKPGQRYMADGKELYKEGDQGTVSAVIDEGRDSRVVIQWGQTGHKSVVQLHAMKNRFVRAGTRQAAATGAMLVGSTTAGFVFALDLATGNELWATWASNEIAGVKGSVAANNGVVVVATDRCTDRYCYRYRNQTMPLTAGNSYVRGLSAADGSALWEFKTVSPVWNMNPLWGNDGSVMFQDWEGRLYCLDLLTGARRYQVGGDWGTHTNAAAVFSAGHNIVITMGMIHYEVNNYHMEDAIGRTPSVKYCNPYPAPGILPHCNTWPGLRGFVRGYNASSGHMFWEKSTPEPPSGASIGQMSTMGTFGTRLALTMGHNCFHNSPTQIWLMDPDSGDVRWMRDGPTLWTSSCASDKEGADIRRAMGGRAECKPNSWSTPVLDSAGDVYVGNQVGVLERIGAPNGGGTRDVQVLSTLTTGSAFQDSAIAFADGVMAVATCTSLIVFQTYADNFTNETWSYMPGSTHDFHHFQPSY
jgi:outer membrane protein assembly factor BamB